MKYRSSILLPAAIALLAGFAAPRVEAAPKLYVKDIKFEYNGGELGAGANVRISRTTDELTFKVLLGVLQDGASTPTPLALDDSIVVSGSPVLKFRLFASNTSATSDGSGDHAANLSGSPQYEASGSGQWAVLRFLYSPTAAEVSSGLAGFAPNFTASTGYINLSGGSVATESDGYSLDNSRNGQGFVPDFVNGANGTFTTYSRSVGVEVNTYAGSVELEEAVEQDGLTVEVGKSKSFTVSRTVSSFDMSGLAASSSDSGKVTASKSDDGATDSQVSFVVTGVAEGTASVLVKDGTRTLRTIPVTVTLPTEKVPLGIAKVTVVKDDEDGAELASAEDLSVPNADIETLKFRVYLGVNESGTVVPFSTIDEAKGLAVSGSPSLNVRVTNVADAKNRSISVPYSGKSTKKEGTSGYWAVAVFSYTPGTNDWFKTPRFVTNGETPFVSSGSSISAKSGASDCELGDDYDEQAADSDALASDFSAYAANVVVDGREDPPPENGMSIDPASFVIGERQTISTKLTLGKVVDADTVIDVVNNNASSRLTFPSSVTVPAGRNYVDIFNQIRGGSGLVDVEENELTFSDPAGYFSTATLYVTVTNTPVDESARAVSFVNAANPTAITFVPPILNEGASTVIVVNLGSQVPSDRTFSVSVAEPNIASVSPSSIEVHSGVRQFSFTVTAVDGPSSTVVTVRDEAGFYATSTFTVTVLNVDPEFRIPAGGAGKKSGLVNVPVDFSVDVSDKGSRDTIALSWDFGERDPIESPLAAQPVRQSKSYTWNDAGSYTVTIIATDKDGATATATFEVEVKPSVSVDFSAIPPGSPSGAYTATQFDFKDPAWGVTNAGTYRFTAKSAINVAPVLPDGVFPLGWYAATTEDGVADATDLRIVNTSTNAALFSAPEEGTYNLYHFSSWPYLPYRWNGYSEPFGDFDQDGLGDLWEAKYLTNEVARLGTQESFPQLSVTLDQGVFGAAGNLDADTLPTSKSASVTEVWFKYLQDDGTWTSGGANHGWFRYEGFFPEGTVDASADGWQDKVMFVTNVVSAYKYPLVKDDGWFYATPVVVESDVENSAAPDNKPAFSNLDEFRGRPRTVSYGLPEALASDADALAALEDRPADWAAFGSQFRYAPALVSPDAADRGDSPATDPMLADTDDDKLPDGWEAYFWSTIYHGTHPENWRAYDPTFRLYSASSASAGIPLLMRNGGAERQSEPVSYADAVGVEVSSVPGASIEDGALVLRGFVPVRDPFSGELVELAPVSSLSGAVATDTASGEISLDPSAIDELGRAIVWVKGEKDGEEFCLRLGNLDLLTGHYQLFVSEEVAAVFGKGFDGDAASATFAFPLSLSGSQIDGVFPREALLSVFDPVVSAADNPPDLSSYVKNAGYGAKWNAAEDIDNDGLTNYEEFLLGTNPLHWDTDADGMPDGWEVLNGLSPLSATDDDGASGNPDKDIMYSSGVYKHARAMIQDFDNETFWDGGSANEFVPSTATIGSSGPGWSKFSNLEEFLVAQYYIQLCGDPRVTTAFGGPEALGGSPVTEVYPDEWESLTPSPVKSDSNGNELPDGWSLYVGVRPVGKSGALFTIEQEGAGSISGYVLLWYEFYGEPFAVGGTVFDPDADGLDWWQEFTFYSGDPKFSITENKETTIDSSGTNVVIGASRWLFPSWKNKTHSTSPWNPDTDGDGLPDRLEYTDVGLQYNTNGDDGQFKWIVNFSPTSVDTDADGLPDAWEYLNGTYDTENPLWLTGATPDGDQSTSITNSASDAHGFDVSWQFGPYGDPDGDGIPNYQEYLTAAVYGWRYDHWYSPDSTNLWMADRAMTAAAVAAAAAKYPDYGFDSAADAFPFGRSVHFRHYDPADFFRPVPRQSVFDSGAAAVERVETLWGVDPADSTALGNDYDSDDVRLLQRAWALLSDSRFLTLPSADQASIAGLVSAIPLKEFSYGRTAPAWDTVLTRQYEFSAMPEDSDGTIYTIWLTALQPSWFGLFSTYEAVGDYTYIPANFIGPAGFPGTYARNPDTDNDAMPDSWEIFHGLNPLYGNGHIVKGAGSHPDETASTTGETFTDASGVQHWLMSEDPASVRVLSPVPGSRGISPAPISREPTVFRAGSGLYQAEAQPYDLFSRPWLAGDPLADPDQDGISNLEESMNEMAPSLLHHTDPSPYWITDTRDPFSFASLYYATGSLGSFWAWNYPAAASLLDAPSYLFSFETNEGYDTDNDNVPDREEVAGGGSDPLDADSPMRRKALYFDGTAAARTRNPFAHDKWTLAAYTAEFWFRAVNPAAGHPQTLLDRPVWMPVDSSGVGPNPGWEIRHTFLAELDSDGTLVASVDNDARESSAAATRVSVRVPAAVTPNRWYHVAMVMDPDSRQFSCYVDGRLAASAICTLKPCTGALFGSHWRVGQNTASYAQDLAGNSTLLEMSVTNLLVSGYSPAPIVLGASDRNPWGVVSADVDMDPWGLPRFASLRGPDFDPDRYFEGWIDEVRIWDRARSASEIADARYRRFTREEILAVNERRRIWDWQNLASADSLSEFPQKLLYHYSFDNLPDPIDGGAREFPLSPADTSVEPEGFDSIARIRPTSYVPWWGGLVSPVVSTAYAPDPYSAAYVPFIENTAAHLPQRPPIDLPLYRAVWDSSSYKLTGYRRADASAWVFDSVSFAESGLAKALSSAAPQIDAAQVPNTMNPYGQVYFTAPGRAAERNPNNFGGGLDEFGLYEGVPLLSDMLPLGGAVADVDVPLWDDLGPGWDMAAVDSDGDGLPDWWEIANGLDPNDASGQNGAYGDFDADGLDNWAEYMAGTNPRAFDTDGDGYSDYFSRHDGSSLSWGELFDDGDRMPNDWESEHGLDPNSYDAEGDLDLDGWTNWEEYMAGTDPNNAAAFPAPPMFVTYDYAGPAASNATLVVETYSEKRTSLDPLAKSWASVSSQGGSHIAGASTWAQTGDPVHEMGGAYDGRYYTPVSYHRFSGVLNPEYQAELNGVLYNVVHLGATHIDRASAENNLVLELRAWKPEKYLADFVFGRIGEGQNVVYSDTTGQSWPATLKAQTEEWGCFQPVTFMLDDETGEIVYGENGESIAYWGLLLEYETGALYFGEAFKGLTYITDAVTVPAFTVGANTYPKLATGFNRDTTGHMRSGYNRFWGYLDANGNGQFDVGEPGGLSTERPTSVSWNPVEAFIPLTTEGPFGFPRIDISGSTNASDYVTVVFYRNAEASAIGEVKVRKPRTYVHENDYIVNSVYLNNGIPFGSVTTMDLKWEAYDATGKYKSGVITNLNLGVQIPTTDEGFRPGRREMVPIYPVQKQTIYSSPVELKWKMDHRTMGVYVTIQNITTGATVANRLYVPFPTPHGDPADNDFYYTCRPQLESGDGKFVNLPSGLYRFTVEENLNSTASAATAQKIYLECNLVLDEDAAIPEDQPEKRAARDSFAVSGIVRYYGKTMSESTLVDAVASLAGSEESLTDEPIAYSGDLVPGTLRFELVSGGKVVDSMSDYEGIGVTGDSFGVLGGTGREEGRVFRSGSVNYEDKTFSVVFDSAAVPAGSTIRLVKKAFPVPLVIQAFRQNAAAESGAGVSGVPCAELRTTSKGPYALPGVSAGTYVVRAFLDSNGNGLADDWETQGYGLLGGVETPSVPRDAPPVVLSSDRNNIDIVLFDRDTDSDLLPDSWEFLKFQSAVSQSSALKTMYSSASQKAKDRMVLQWLSGYDKTSAGLSYWRQFADGELDSDPRTPDTDGDGLTDAMELLVTGTDTHLVDSDGDGLSDLEEFLSGSDPMDADDAVPYSMPALAFDEDGAPYVDCPYPALRADTVLEFQLWRAPELGEAFEEVFCASVAATNAAELVDASKNGVPAWQMPAGVLRMVPDDAADTLDWKSGFYRVHVVADVGKVVVNEDGTRSWWTWTVSEDGQTWSWSEAARGAGETLERNAADEWYFTDAPTGLPGSIVRDPDGSWRLVE